VLEDESGRILLTGECIEALIPYLVTGVCIAVRGRVQPTGDISVYFVILFSLVYPNDVFRYLTM
jgi:hypothetical protein